MYNFPKGAKVTLRLVDGTIINGWLYGENHLGRFISLDREGKEVRFIRDGDRTPSSMRYTYDDMADFASTDDERQRLHELADTIAEPFSEALDAANYTRFREILARSVEGINRHRHSRRGTLLSNEDLLLVATFRHDYLRLVKELHFSGLLQILFSHSTQLRRFVSPDTLPDHDLLFASQVELETFVTDVREKDRVKETNAGADILGKLPEEKLIEAARDEKLLRSRESRAQTNKYRLYGPIGKFLTGTALASGNVLIGSFAGVMAALPTLALGTVAGALGVAMSIYTGLNASCDALKDIAAALEDKTEKNKRSGRSSDQT